jgi:energy-coupling factor transporter ATP-binding protein EcfA2
VATTLGFPGRPGSSGQPGSSDRQGDSGGPDSAQNDVDVDGGVGIGGGIEFRPGGGGARTGWDGSQRDPLQRRVDALGELLGLSRTRVDPDALAEAGELLDRVAERRRLSLDHTVVALAGATGSGKSSLFNALTGLDLSEVGVRRPTTQWPLACAWDPRGAAALLDRLGVPAHARFARRSLLDGVHTRPGGSDTGFEGLILLDLPDHDSASEEHRRQVDRLLELVDVLVWVVDPEKYADAVLHERYLRPLAGHADVTLVVLNQVDRLPYDAADQVLDDLRRLLDEDGLALGEHGDPGAVVLPVSALTGEGIADLRATIGQIVADRTAADRRLAADVDRATERLRPIYVGYGSPGLTDSAREGFVARLAEAVGADAVGRLAEREWSEAAGRACGVPWSRLVERAPMQGDGGTPAAATADEVATVDDSTPGDANVAASGVGAPGIVSGAVASAVRARVARLGLGSWHRDRSVGSAPLGAEQGTANPGRCDVTRPATARPLVAEAIRTVAAEASEGLPTPWSRAVHDAAERGSRGLPEALDVAVANSNACHIDRPRWWAVVGWAQWLLMVLSVVGAVGLVAVAVRAMPVSVWLPALLFVLGTGGGPMLAWACRTGSRGTARRYGQHAERRLRDAAADCGRARVLEPVAAELLRYREVREQYGVAMGAGVPEPRG